MRNAECGVRTFSEVRKNKFSGFRTSETWHIRKHEKSKGKPWISHHEDMEFLIKKTAIPILCLLAVSLTRAEPGVLLDVDFREGEDAAAAAGLLPLEEGLPGTGLRTVPHRAGQGVPQALVRDLREQPLWQDGRLQIARNEVEQGMHRVFSPARPLDPAEEVLVMRSTTFSDASTGGTNSIGVRLWVQNGRGPNEHRERMELSTHFNLHARGSRQVYPNAYVVREGWETWAMPEGTNSRRAGIYYRLAAEGRNAEIRGADAVPLGFYWTWEGLDWPQGWRPPVGGGLYEPPARGADVFPGDGLYSVTAIWARSEQALAGQPHAFATRVDLLAPRGEGRVLLEAPLPPQVEEIRILLRSETPAAGRDWVRIEGLEKEDALFLGVADARVAIHPRADVNLDGQVDLDDWDVLRLHAGKAEALHIHGDLTGDGRVGLADAFFLAARLPAGPRQNPISPEQWRAWRDAENRLVLHVPAGGRMYGWMLDAREPLHKADSFTDVFGEGALREISENRLGEINLRHPFSATEAQAVPLSSGPVLEGMAFPVTIRILTRPGAEALTLPVMQRPLSESFEANEPESNPPKDTP